MSLSIASPGDLEFAFPHAVNLAELGQSPMDKRIGVCQCPRLITGVNFAFRLYFLHGTYASRSRTSAHVGEHVAKSERPRCRVACDSCLNGP